MKYLLLLAIRIYWMIPTKLHKRCIFRETCSHYVYRIASQQGFFEGLRALKVRNELCRPGYVVYRSQGRYYLQTANGSVFAEDEIALSELPPHNLHILDLDSYLDIKDDKMRTIFSAHKESDTL
ncbi:MAG: membrane protein insertion efficiency factor YidD [Prevotella sp.]|nr:membrane protein insertion efficiency factor YidD [Prevotella sp.]